MLSSPAVGSGRARPRGAPRRLCRAWARRGEQVALGGRRGAQQVGLAAPLTALGVGEGQETCLPSPAASGLPGGEGVL